MDWQSIVAVGVAIACGLWAAWKFVSPFLTGSDGCTSCGDGGRRSASQETLLDIDDPHPS